MAVQLSPDRQAAERSVAKALHAQIVAMRRAIAMRAESGEEVSPSFFAGPRDEIARVLAPALLAVFVAACVKKGMPESIARLRGERWAASKASEVAAGLVKGVVKKLNQLAGAGGQWSEFEARHGRMPSARRIETDLIQAGVLNRDQVQSIAITEVTRAQSVGGDVAMVWNRSGGGVAVAEEPRDGEPGEPGEPDSDSRTPSPQPGGAPPDEPSSGDSGDAGDDIWMTEEDARVCPICGPLHGSRRRVWGRIFPDGPPAHPRCRCEIVYTGDPGHPGPY